MRGPPPSYKSLQTRAVKPGRDQRQDMKALEITQASAEDLNLLSYFNIAFVMDDSGSMRGTRWVEMQVTLSLVIRIGAELHPDGIDVFPLNRDGMRGVTCVDQMSRMFVGPPSGDTPLSRTLKSVLTHNDDVKTPLLVIIGMDGEPTDDAGNVNKQEFIDTVSEAVHNETRKTCVAFLCFSLKGQDVGWLSALKKLPNVSVCGPYEKEHKKVLSGDSMSGFTVGDFVIKSCIGAIDSLWDDMCLETGHVSQQPASARCGCTVL